MAASTLGPVAITDPPSDARGANYIAKIIALILGLLVQMVVTMTLAFLVSIGDTDKGWRELFLAVALVSFVTVVALLMAVGQRRVPRWGRWVLCAQVVVQFALAFGLGTIAFHEAISVSSLGPENGAGWVLVGIVYTGSLLLGCGDLALRSDDGRIAGSRRRIISGVGVVAMGALFLTGVAAAVQNTRAVGCSQFSFDRERWADSDDEDSERIGAALVRCRSLVGKSAADVSEMFGMQRRVERLVLSSRTGLIGDLETQELLIEYDRTDHVSSARLSDPPAAD